LKEGALQERRERGGSTNATKGNGNMGGGQSRGKKSSLDEAAGSDIPSVITAIIIVVIALTAVVCVGGGVYMFMKRRARPKIETNRPDEDPEAAAPSAEPIPPADMDGAK